LPLPPLPTTGFSQLLQSPDERALNITFSLFTSTNSHSTAPPVELGSGSLSLRSVLREGRDRAHRLPVRLSAVAGPVGTLSTTIRISGLQLSGQRTDTVEDPYIPGQHPQPASTTRDAAEFLLVAADPTLAREGPGLVERFLVQPPTDGVEGNADCDTHVEQQAKRFKDYLRNKSVSIDVWDGTSLLQVGTARVPLAALLRKSNEQVGNAGVVKEYLSVDLLATQLTSIDAAPSADAAIVAAPLSRGKLKLVIARLSVEKSATSHRPKGSTVGRGQSRSTKVLPVDATSNAFALGDGDSPDEQIHKVRSRSLKSGGAASMLSGEQTSVDAAGLYKRQLRRQKQREWLRLSSSTSAVVSSTAGKALGSIEDDKRTDEEQSLARARLQLQMRELRAAEAYRQSHKELRLRALLLSATHQVHYVFPHYGGVEFVEVPFRNPYGVEHCFEVTFDDPLSNLTIVTSKQEWMSLKAQHGLNTPAEELLLKGQQLWLMPQETVFIPLKYQAWQHGQVRLDRNRAQSSEQIKHDASFAIARRSIHVCISNVKGEEVASIELRVRPQPYVVDQRFRFHQSESEFLKTTIRLQRVRWHSTDSLVDISTQPKASRITSGVDAPLPVRVVTSDPNVVAGVHEQRLATDPIEVSIKYKCAASPSVNRFLVLVYSDFWMHKLLETWEIIVHSLQRIDVHTLVGQASVAKVAKPTHAHA